MQAERNEKVNKAELVRCEQFLLENGWKRDNEEGEEFDSYYKNNSIGVDLSKDEIVFIGDSGDFLHIALDYFALVGALIEYHQIGLNYVSTKHQIN